MQDINSLPPVPQGVIDAMQREAEKKFGKVPGLEEVPQQPQINPILQHHEEPQSIDLPENVESQSEVSGQEQSQDDNRGDIAATNQTLSDKEYNFKVIRERAKQAERERDEALRILKEIQQGQQQYKAPIEQPQAAEPQDFNINPDDLVEGKHLNKFAQEIYQLKQQLQQNQQQSYQAAMEARLKAQYPDLERVLSADNIETFKMAYPELAASVAATSDYYNKAVSAYTMIKKFGIHQEESNALEKQAIQRNNAKPRPLASVSPQQGDSPISRANAFANGLTKDLKDQLFKEMNDARRGY